MRVTNSMLINRFMQNLNNNAGRMEKYHSQLTTGKRFSRPSDDPVGITRSLQARRDLSIVKKYSDNVNDAQTFLHETETALMEINSILGRAYELAGDAANDTKTPEDRQHIQKEIEQLKQQLINTANSDFAGRYIFGGYNTVDKPFKVDDDGNLLYNGKVLYNPNDLAGVDNFDGLKNEGIKYEIGPGVYMDVSTPGCELLGIGDKNVYAMLDKFSKALEGKNSNGDPLENGKQTEVINECIGLFQGKSSDILSQVAEVGGKTNRLELVAKRFQNDEDNYKKIKSEVEDVDQEEATIEFKMAEMAYRSSLAVGARIIQPTLIDFLR
ncbi:MAG: flagellar hook-associated protein FlgL [Xylanivirga thermophila]|jgi:flagellar hook-associated protein 3 FlgL|uniref:flagellar hook-associated protein FlgL n=1 Tax=Xylanivirga thermophila TaxID=2496273 RepID=UPI0039F602FC